MAEKTIVIRSVKTSFEAESRVDGPRNGVSDPELAHLETLPALPADPTLEIPMSSFAREMAKLPLTTTTTTTNTVRHGSLADIPPPVSSNSTQRLAAKILAATTAPAETKAETKAEPTQDGAKEGAAGWREVKPSDADGKKKEEAAPDESMEDGPDPVIEKPMDAMLIQDPAKRERAWRRLARKLYDRQPAFLDRGKQRWNGLVEYDHMTNRVLWNKKPVPNSSLWRATFDHAQGRPNLGKVVLVLMEKNESKIIERMLGSIIDDIDGFIILDTGSTDGTESVMWEFLVTKHGKPGAIYKTDWYDFGTNRTITVQLAHNTGDWLLLMDADYRLERQNKVDPQAWRKQLPPLSRAPAWLLLNTTGDLAYSRPHVVQGAVRWCYVCRTHEYLSRSVHDKSSVTNWAQEMFPALLIDHVGDGQSKSDKLGRDIVMLLMDQMDDPKSERAPFYLGNTLKEIRMPDFGLRAYKTAMNLCSWNEEIYMSAKGALSCMFQKNNVSFERMLAMALHGITQNPDRLELLSVWLRKIRTTREWWPKYAHLAASLGAYFTHNVYPDKQKLFIENNEHNFGFWQEVSICAFYTPIYFELGLHMSQKVLNLPAFKDQAQPVQQQCRRNRQLYEQRLHDWKTRGVRVSAAIRKHLIEQGHRAFAQGKFAKAKEWYQHVLHPVVLQDLVPEHLVESRSADERKLVGDLCDHFSSPMFHTFHRLTAWQSAKCQSGVVTEVDQDRALACFQMGQANARIAHAAGDDKEHRVLTAMHYVDALKFVPGYPPATAALYELTVMKSSDLTRCILYLMRLTSMSTMATLSQPLLRNVKATLETLLSDQSEFTHRIQPSYLPNTAWIMPMPPPEHHVVQATSVVAPWANIIQPQLLTLSA